MNDTHWMPLYTGDYLRDTRHLSAEEHGAYLLLLMAYWDRGGPLPNDDKLLAKLAQIEAKRWTKKVAPTIKLMFVRDGDLLRHKRVDAELARLADRSEKARKSASKRWQKADTEPPRDPSGGADESMRSHSDGNANGHAKAMLRARVPQPQPQPQYRQATSLVLVPDPAPAPPGVPADAPYRPCRNDRPEAWARFAQTWETDQWGDHHACFEGWHMDVVADLLCEAAGIADYDWRPDWSPVLAWLRDEIDLHGVVLPTLRRISSRPGYRPPGGWAYFDSAVRAQPRLLRA